MDAGPGNSAVSEVAGAKFLEKWAPAPNLLVAAHTDRGRGNAGERRCLDASVAVSTIDSVVGDVVTVIELNDLLNLAVLAGIKRTVGVDVERADRQQRGPQQNNHDHPENSVRASWKEGAH